jgi:hypothetical protein
LLRYLAKTTTRSKFRSITYIVKLTKLKKKANPLKKNLPLLKTISQILNRFQKSRYIADTCNVLKAQAPTFGHKKGRVKRPCLLKKMTRRCLFLKLPPDPNNTD